MIRQLLKTQKRGLSILVGFGFLSAISSFYMNYVRLYVLDFVFGEEYASFVVSVILVLIMAAFTYFTDNIGWDYYVTKVNLKCSKYMKLNLHDLYEKMDYSEALKFDVGYLSNLENVGKKVCDYLTSTAYSMTSNVLEIILSTFFIIAFIHYKLLIFMVILLPMTMVVHYLGKKISEDNKVLMKENAMSANCYLDYISKLDFVKANGLSENLLSLFHSKIDNIKKTKNRILFIDGIYSIITSVLNFLLQLLVPIYGAYLLSKREISASALLNASLIFSSFLTPSMLKISSMLKEYKSLVPLFGELNEFEQLASKKVSSNITFETFNENTLLVLEGMKYYYQEGKYILDSVNLTLPTTGLIGIMGKSGSGKSTLLKIIAGLLFSTEGCVKYNRKYLSSYPDLNCDISYISQEPRFFSVSIKDNLGDFNETIKFYAEKIGLDNVIESLPDKYETVINENGTNLSGGQKQSVSILRGLSKKSYLYIFDESTSSLDEESEHKCLMLLKKISQTACVLIVSHRKKTLDVVDTLYELRDKQLFLINR